MSEYRYLTLREEPAIKDKAAEWFNSKWGVPKEAYLECMEEYLSGETEYGWYLCLDGEKIVAGMGVIENDFHDRKDLAPNVCAVYTEEEYRGKQIPAGKKSVMLSLKIGNDDSTMTSKQIEKKMNGIIKVLGNKCGAQLR